MKKWKISMTTQAVVLLSILLLAGNLVLGIVIMKQSRSVIKTLLNDRMLDISNTSADMINGDVLKHLTKEDEGTPEYQKIYDNLKVFQDNINLSYIYTIRDEGDGTFTFMVDPAEKDPGEFGQQVAVTDALKEAAKGTASVDKEPYSDGWGSFYSAYSPVFDSKGSVAGIVAVDFSSGWYDSQLAKYANIVLLYSIISLLSGALVVFIIMGRLRKKFRVLLSQLHGLGDDVEHLTQEMHLPFGREPVETVQDTVHEDLSGQDKGLSEEKKVWKNQEEEKENQNSGDEISEIGKRIHSMQDRVQKYIDQTYVQSNRMITALASDYRSVYYIDLDTDEGICYRSHSKMENGLGEGEHFSFLQKFTDYADRYVAEEFREDFLRFIEPGAIREGLERENIITFRYLVNRGGQESYEMLKFAPVRKKEEREDHLIHAVGAGFTDVDVETRENMVQKQALSDALALAEEANHAKTAFLSSMSHEIRTPMNAIIGLDSIALNDPEISDKTRDYLVKIGFSARHLLELINDILDMSRIESGRMVLRNEEFSFSKFIEQINTMAGGQCAEKGLQYECSMEGDFLDYYIGDDMKLKQVIINILGNAVKFTPEGGLVRFFVKQAAHYEGKTTLRFKIQDTGIGMDESFLPKIFDSFSQEDASATNKYGSTGLGMAISKNMVEMMNGNIEVESQKGVGTTFTVTITLMDSERVDNVPSSDEILPQGLSVLVVDDDPVACDHAQAALERVGISSEQVTSGAEALEKIRLHHARREPYDLILVDWKMPEMDGIETTRQIREILGPESAIVILTAYHWDEIVEEAKKAGVDGFLAKPLFAANVLDEFKKAVHKKKELDQKEKKDLRGCRILLAEDTLINAEIMKEILSMEEIEVDHAENGWLAVEMFASHPVGYYDAILMDMRMPEMDGLTATGQIRSMRREDAGIIPIIALTANAFDEDVQRSLQAGLNAHLSKPVDPDVLFETLESLL